MAVRGLQRRMVFGGILAVALITVCLLEQSEVMAETEMSQNIELVTESAPEVEKSETDLAESTDSTNFFIKTDKPEVLNEYDDEIKDVTKVTDDLYVVTTESPEKVEEVSESLDKKDEVEKVFPDIKVEAQDITSDSIVQAISDKTNISWGTVTSGFDHYTDWLNLIGGKKVVVAVLDTGIYADHEVFRDNTGKSRICSDYSGLSYDYVNNDSDPADDSGHGTSVAGIVAESTPSNVCILPVKVLNYRGEGSLGTIVTAMKSAGTVADVLNLSLGVPQSLLRENNKRQDGSLDDYYELLDAFDIFAKQLIDKTGTTIVASAGNEGESEIGFPASSQYVLATTSISVADPTIPSFEFTYRWDGFTYGSSYGLAADFAMPGAGLMIPCAGNLYSSSSVPNPKACYRGGSGTSYSSPHLAAAVALLKSDPDFGKSNMKESLKKYATDYGTAGWDEYYGHGVVDYEKNMFKKGRAKVSSTLSEDRESATLTGKALSINNLVGYAFTETADVPSSWTNIGSAIYGESKAINEISKTVTENGTYYFWVKNSSNDVISAAVTVTDINTPEQAPIKDGVYSIHSALDLNKVVDIAGASSDNGANAQLYTANHSVAQKFLIRHIGNNIYEIENLKSQKLLDVAGAGKTNGTNVWQYAGNSTCAQQFRVKKTSDGYFYFISTCSELYLDVAGASTKDGANIQLYSANGTKAQKFAIYTYAEMPSVQVVSNGDYVVKSTLNLAKTLDISGGSRDNGGNLQLYAVNGTLAQTFTVEYLKDGFYRITNKNSAKVLDVAGGMCDNAGNVQQYTWNGTMAQQWMIEKTSDGKYTFVSRCNMQALDVSGGQSKNGTNIQIYESNSTASQKFELSKK